MTQRKPGSSSTRHAPKAAGPEAPLRPPFPFVGAGEAQYFEWAELYVRFERAPTGTEREQIVAGVPKPIDDVKWNGAVLWASSDQGVGRQISAAYSSKPSLPAELTASNRFHAAAGDKVARFNAHIELWLEAIHAITPILVAVRRQDFEAGGTQLSAWHHASVAAIPSALEAMIDAPCAYDLDVCKRLTVAAKDANQPVSPRLVPALTKKCEPLVEELEAAEADESEAAEAAEKARYQAALSVPATYDVRSLRGADEATFETAMGSLEAAMPKLAKALRKVPARARSLRPGATVASINAVEKALGRTLTTAHRAILLAFDGGTVGDLIFPGTEATGARGRDSLVAFARALALRGWEINPVVRYEDKKYGDSLVYTKGDTGAQQLSYLVELTRKASSLDTLLADIVKAGKIVGSWS